MLKKVMTVFCVVAFAVFMGGCSKSKKSGEGSSDVIRSSDVIPDNDATATGTVDYYTFTPSDKVCFDINANKLCDADEPSAIPDNNGNFSIAAKASVKDYMPLVVELHGTKSTTSPFIAAATATGQRIVLEATAGTSEISALSTMIKAKMDTLYIDEAAAKATTIRELGLDANSTAVEVKEKNNQIIDVLVAMINKLATLGVEIDGNALLYIASETAGKLADVVSTKTADAVAGEIVGSKTKDDIQKAANTLDAAKPKLQTMAQILENGELVSYQPRYSSNKYEVSVYQMKKDVLNTSNSTFDIAKANGLPLPNTFTTKDVRIQPGGAFSFGSGYYSDGRAKFEDSVWRVVKTIPLNGKKVSANNIFRNSDVGPFGEGALMYVINTQILKQQAALNLTDERIEKIRNEHVDNNRDEAEIVREYSNASYEAQSDGSIAIRSGEIDGEIVLNPADKTFDWFRVNNMTPSTKEIFSLEETPSLKGTYTETGAGANLVIKGTTERGDIFLYLPRSNSTTNGKLVIFTKDLRSVSRFFNDKAMQTILKEWNENTVPNFTPNLN